ncbi:aminoacylase-1-like [Anneissia japonica]|uniref:aminoacylase-1-like n=1 Tax=Anneissia japonica TaxID=1529436 RepID=UPI001425AB4C|nr:aminoacylase-1-like [Anneissia japonica]
MSVQNAKKKTKTEESSVTNFRNYLRIKTVEPNPDYDGAIRFLQQMAGEIKLPCKVVEVHPGKEVVIITWEGTDPKLKSIVLNSHTDVVPVYPESWICDAFEGKKMENGNIYGRGTQDMKSVTIQYLEAIRNLKNTGKRFPRTIHMTFVPGLANPTDAFTVFYGERSPWWFKVICTGNTGHGSRFIENTAAEKLQKIMNSFLGFREEEKARLESVTKPKSCKTLADVTTVNLTMLEGGVAQSVVPQDFTATFDIRIPPTVNLQEFEDKINNWVKEAGEGVRIEYQNKNMCQEVTSVDKESPWWCAFSNACDEMKMKIETEIFPAATDSRYLRAAGYPCLGFSPMNNTPILLHDHNEFVNEEVFLKGIDIYENLISKLANVAPLKDERN